MKTLLQHPALPPLLTGLLLALCAPGWGLYPLAWVGLVPLLVHTWHATPRQAALRFFLAGCMYHLMVLHWLMTNVFWAGGWAFTAYAALSIALSLVYWLPLGALFAWMRPRLHPWTAAPALACLWAAMEMLQARLFTGFGWAALGYWQGPGIYAVQWAALGGVTLVGLFIVLVNALLAQAWRERKFRMPGIAAALALTALVHVGGYAMLKEPEFGEEPYRAGIYQSNYPQEMKWDRSFFVEMVERAAEMSATLAQYEPVDLFVWPEALVMDDLGVPSVGDPVRALTRSTGVPLFTGISRLSPESRRYRNSAVLVDAEGEEAGHYDKLHYVPFGEYVPFHEYLTFLSAFVPAGGGADPGDGPVVIPNGGRGLGPLICFEVLFSPMSLDLRDLGADFLVVVTNLAWFGASSAIPQEFELARMRAIETRLPLVHASNTGVSGVIDPYGRFESIAFFEGYNGQLVEWRVSPMQQIMRRGIGSVPVPLPAEQALPAGPRYFPWMALAAAALLVLVALVRPRQAAPAS